jgi:hypothetical protein
MVLASCQEQPLEVQRQNGIAGIDFAPLEQGGITAFYADDNGSPSGNGTIGSPWDLSTALAKPNTVIGAGDTLYLLGGTYYAHLATGGRFTSSLQGSSWSNSGYVVIRNNPGDLAILEGSGLNGNDNNEVLRLTGSYVEVLGLVVRDSYGTNRTDPRPHLIVNSASHTRYRNLVVHDGGDAFYNFPTRTDVTIEGCVFYNNGFVGDALPDHAIYVRSNASAADPIRIRHNIIFNQFGYGVHAYADASGDGGNVNYVYVDTNIVFNGGALGSTGKANIIVGAGSGSTATGNRIIGNYTYKSVSGTNLLVGYSTYQQGSIEVSGNYAALGDLVLDSRRWTSASYTGNTFIGTSQMVNVFDNSGITWSGNTHSRNTSAYAWTYGSPLQFAPWKEAVGAVNDQSAPEPPSNNVVEVRGVVSGRANVVLYNWSNSGTFTFTPPATHFSPGDALEVRHVFDMFGTPVATGTCCNAIEVTVNNTTPPNPYGMTPGSAPSPGTQFAAYVVTRTASAPFTVTILQQPESEEACWNTQYTWQSSTGPGWPQGTYSFTWYRRNVGAGSWGSPVSTAWKYTWTIPDGQGNFELKLVVTAAGQTDEATRTILTPC